MSERADLRSLQRKAFRDSYMQSHVRLGICYQIQALRAQFGLTQAELAGLLSKPQSFVARLENAEHGQVTVQTLLDIASALDVALLVRFVSYPKFLAGTDDVSPEALAVPSFDASLAGLQKSETPATE